MGHPVFVLTYTQQLFVWRKNWWFYKVLFSTLMVDFSDSRTTNKTFSGSQSSMQNIFFNQSWKVELQCILYMATATSIISYATASLPESRSATELTSFFNWSMSEKKNLLPYCKCIGLQIPCDIKQTNPFHTNQWSLFWLTFGSI